MTKAEWNACADPIAMLKYRRAHPKWKLAVCTLSQRYSIKTVHEGSLEVIAPEELVTIWEPYQFWLNETLLIHADEKQRVEQCQLIRCLFPYRRVIVDTSWMSSTARLLIQDIHTSDSFHLMPILADALQDAGCENAEVLDHCRGGGPHARGCWVVDALLGRK